MDPIGPDEDPGGIPVPVRCRDGAADVVDSDHFHACMDLRPGLRRHPGKMGVVALSPGEVEGFHKVFGEDTAAPDVEGIPRPGEVDQPLPPEGTDRQVEDPVEEPDGLLAQATPADLNPGIRLLLKECHPVPGLPEQVGGGAPGGPASDNDGIILRPTLHLRLSSR